MKLISFHSSGTKYFSDLKRPRWLGPLKLAFLLSVALGLGFAGYDHATRTPAPPLGETIPQFSLPPVKGQRLGLSSGDLRGSVSIVNVFASWCGACWEERPVLHAISARRIVPVYGLNYRDDPEEAAHWPDTEGTPYARTGLDRSGDVTKRLGVTALPETLLIDRHGRIVHRHRGALSDGDFVRDFMPLIETMRKGTANQ